MSNKTNTEPKPQQCRYSRSFARSQWRHNFADKQLFRNARQAGNAFSFRTFTGRCAA